MTVRRLVIYSVKRLSEDPYLKTLISRVFCLYRERFHSFSRYATQVFARAIKVFTRNFFFVSRQLLFFQWTTRQWQYESCNKGSISITRIKSTKIGVKETERNKACTHLIRKNSYELVRFLWSYKVHTSEFTSRSDTSKVRVNKKSIN